MSRGKLIAGGALLVAALGTVAWLACKPRAAPRTVLVVGDSLAQGYRQEIPWPEHLPEYGVEAVGLCTEVAAPSAKVLRNARTIRGHYQAAVVLCGTIDAYLGVPPKQYRQTLSRLVAMLPADRVLVLGQPVDLRLRADAGAAYRQAAREVAAAQGCQYLDLAGLLGRDARLYVDRVHLGDEAGRMVARAVMHKLQEPAPRAGGVRRGAGG